MSTENQKNPFLLDQRDFSSYNTLVDADNEIVFKTPGLEIYITSEDKFYYWDGSSWVLENISGASGEANTASNVGTGEGVFKDKLGVDLRFKTLKQGANITLTASADEILISATDLDSQSASEVSYNNVVSDLISTNVQDALDELASLRESVCVSASRNANATNIYLRSEDGTPTNLTPFVLQFDATLTYISSATDGNETWVAEVHKDNILVVGATLTSTNVSSNYSTYNINFSAGDKISLYCNGTSIQRPKINLVFRKR